jgi:cysteine-rich repeat protein
LAETDANKDIEIFSVFKSLDPKQPGEHSDTATLKIQFLDPAVVNSYPTCNSACPNSLIYAQFNTSMAIENDWSGKVNVFPCLSAACTTFAATGQLAGNAIYNEETKTVNFILKDGALLLPNTYYRAIIDAGIFSTSKKALADSYSWKFKTKDGAAACAPQKVEVWPKKTTSFKKGEFILYQAAPMGDPAGCDSAGDFLAPNAYSWSWESLKPTVAMISTDQRNVDFPKYCDAKCRVKGSVSKDTAAICGDGKIEIGEECDDSNAKDGDGCSAKCLNEGTIACVNLKDANCCGNSIKDKGESCDDGNAKDGDGCGA